jgi:iron complex outermembrane receptor protein
MRVTIVLACALLLYASSQYTLALDVSPPSKQAADLFDVSFDQLEEIVVIGPTRRTATDLQQTPAAISTINAAEFDKLFAQNIGEIAVYVPNFSAATATGFNAASFAIRGASETDVLVYFDPKVGVIVDDFVIPHVQTQLLEPFDIESIEVLRGPQGTLFGKNTTAGAIVVRTKQPQLGVRSFDSSIQYGSYQDTKTKASLNWPVSDTLAIRLAALYQTSEGYYENGKVDRPVDALVTGIGDAGLTDGSVVRGNGSNLGGRNVFSGRLKMLFKPNEKLSLRGQLEFIRDRSDPLPVVNDTAADSGQTAPLFGFPGVSSGDPLKQAGIHKSQLVNLDGTQEIDVLGAYLNVEYAMSKHRLYGLFGIRQQESRIPNEYLGTAYTSFFAATRDDDRDTMQAEFRIASDRSGPFNYVLGGFFQSNDVEFCVLQQLGLTEFFGTAIPGVLDNRNPLLLCNRQDATAYAIYADGAMQLSPRIQLSFGARYTEEDKKFVGREGLPTQSIFPGGQFDKPLSGQNFALATDSVREDRQEWIEPTWRTSLSYQLSENHYGYLLAAKGFKSGGYNDQAGSGGFANFPLEAYDPEFAHSYEVGLRSRFADDRLRLNATYFLVNYEDFQRSTVVSLPDTALQETRTFNAAEVRATGLELELSALLKDNFTARINVGLLDAEYDKFLLDRNLDGIFEDFSNREVVRAPQLTAGIDLTYVQALRSGHQVSWNMGFLYEDQNTYYYNDDVGAAYDTELEERTVLNASFTWRHAKKKYWFSLFGKNLMDDRYRIASQAVGALWTFSNYGPPVTYGVEFGVHLTD